MGLSPPWRRPAAARAARSGREMDVASEGENSA